MLVCDSWAQCHQILYWIPTIDGLVQGHSSPQKQKGIAILQHMILGKYSIPPPALVGTKA